MLRHVYWQAPLWEVVLATAALVAVVAWLARRALRRPSVARALRAVDDGLADAVLFHFHPAQGLTPLSEGARSLLAAVAADTDERGLEAAMVAALVRAAEGGEDVRVEDWPTAGRALLALGLPHGERDLGRALAVVVPAGRGAEPARAAVPPTPDVPEATDDAWQSLGPGVRVHRSQPSTLVRRDQDAAATAATRWQRHALAYGEERLLRALLASTGRVLPAERLFAAVWPDEPVGRHGLRPDQRDRLRRLVFQLRQHVEPVSTEPRHLRTAHGIGYALYIDGGAEAGDGRLPADDATVDS